MTIRLNIVRLVGLAAVLFFAGIGGAAAELQECFRDGYLCSIKCDKARLDKAASASCQARCNADEKVCTSEVAAERRPSAVRYFPAAAPMKLRPVSVVQHAAR